jgi:AcrR family transcriptional regulator
MATRRRRTQAERREQSERRILRAATKLIARRGYTKTTLADIGRAAGCAAGLVSHRFGSKEGLLRELIQRIRSQFYRDRIEQIVAGATELDALERVVDAYLDVLLVREDRLRVLYVLMGEALGPVGELREVFAEVDRDFRSIAASRLAAARDAGRLPPNVDPEGEAVLFVAMLRGVALQWLMSPESFDLERVRGDLKTTLRARLAIDSPSPAASRRPLPEGRGGVAHLPLSGRGREQRG